MLAQELRRIESTVLRGSHVAAPIEYLRQQLAAQADEDRKKDEAMKEKDETLKEKDEALKKKDEALKEKNEALKEKDTAMRTMQADSQQLRSQNSVLHQQLAAKEAEDKQESEEVVGEKNVIIQAQQASSVTKGELTHLLSIHTCCTSIYGQ